MIAAPPALVAVADAAASKYGIDPRLLYALAQVESGWNTKSVGDRGHSHGIMQIYNTAHPNVTQAQAEDPKFAFEWAAANIAGFKKAHPNATPQMLLVQHNSPLAARKLAQGASEAEAEKYTGTGKYIKESYAAYTGFGGTGTSTTVSSDGRPVRGSAMPAGEQTTVATGPTGQSGVMPSVGGGISANVTDPLVRAQTDEEYKNALGQYGFVAGFFKSVPELQGILKEALGKKLDQTNFLGLIQNSQWFKKHTASQRAWTQLQYSDPTEYQRQLRGATTNISQTALAMGVTLTPERLAKMAMQQKSANWSPDELKAALQGEFHYKVGQVLGGAAAQTLDEIRKTASDYAVPLNDASVHGWVEKIASGQTTIDQFHEYAKNWAVSRHPAIKSAIDSGLSVRDYLAPYTSGLASLLEIDPNSIDISKDQNIQAALNYQTTPGSAPNEKPSGVMPIWEFERKVRRDPRWMETDNARQSLMRSGHKVLQDWGLNT